jgi:hypothetical protein
MGGFLERVRAMWGRDGRGALLTVPDGNRDIIVSGIWARGSSLPLDAFPPGLVLQAGDRRLAFIGSEEIVLATTRVGAHTVELLLSAGSENTVDLSLRIPTAANQFKEPYLLMEAEAGNSREVALREIHFHLQGRASREEMARAPWRAFFATALTKLSELRALPR